MIDYTPPAGSFLQVVRDAPPNQDVRCGQVVGKAGGIARDVRHMLDEIERLTAENASLIRALGALDRLGRS